MKQFYKSKRFWVGLTSLITGIGLIVTGDKSLNDSLPEIILTVIGLIQTILGIGTNGTVYVGSKRLSFK